MSKIIKFNNIVLDNDNKINIDVPTFEDIGYEENELELDADDMEDGDADEFSEFGGFSSDVSRLMASSRVSDYDESDDDDIEKAAQRKADELIAGATYQAQNVISSARREADAILFEAEEKAFTQAEEIRKKAEKEGYDDGYSRATQEVQALKDEAEAVLFSAKNQREQMLNSLEPQVVDLVHNTISKILNDSKFINKDIIKCIIKMGLYQTKIKGDVFIHVSEEDYDIALKGKKEIYSITDSNTSLEIIKDTALNPGDCLIETPFGNIECGIDQQLKEFKSSLYYIFDNG